MLDIISEHHMKYSDFFLTGIQMFVGKNKDNCQTFLSWVDKSPFWTPLTANILLYKVVK